MSTNKALFLDRDGIINIDHGYVYKPEDFEFVDGIFELCQKALSLGYKLIVITNQAGIARGYYTQDDFLALTLWMKEKFAEKNIRITDVFFCPHHPTQGLNALKTQCDCRKPAPGMIVQAQQQYKINLMESIFIGDKESDMLAAKNAQVKTRILVASQYTEQVEQNASAATIQVNSVHNAIKNII